jgi:hypothetical protein
MARGDCVSKRLARSWASEDEDISDIRSGVSEEEW